MIKHICQNLPSGKRLIEPFVGSGAVFLNTCFPKYVLAERNMDLVLVYHFIKKEGVSFIDYCESFFTARNNCKKQFYEYRNMFNKTSNDRLRAALFVYLNRHGYNGLCRYNKRGIFNVPFGHYVKPYFPREEMVYFSKRLKQASIKCYDFKQTMFLARDGDVLYCDPPYVPLSPTSNFTQYSPHPFGENEQLELADNARSLAKKGIPVLISNHDTHFIHKAYKGARIIRLNVRRSISCKGESRGLVPEILALFTS